MLINKKQKPHLFKFILKFAYYVVEHQENSSLMYIFAIKHLKPLN